ncbi:response regulator [Reyranella sp. CPCC 100927]|uniref:response regulator n=1 Tax=Reyranella sp. CPCC 100927 TaxID=2599616 RepID=UPI0011B5839F|nr:response regulator transcription factor [Reyranella sp. CPCC 100927]TWT03758.1 response regulator transcription factor [Reyranella sp. CPCC 100927]
MMGSGSTMQSPASMVAEAKPHVLLVEDDAEISRMLMGVLSESGFGASAVGSAIAMDAVLARRPVDLVVLDVMLPGEDGFSICRRLRASSDVPIIMVTARGEDIDRIIGLETGADDYVCKPFNSRELVARIRALLRRAGSSRQGDRHRARLLRFAGWQIDPATRQLHDPEGVRVAMTSVEFDLLAAFCRNPGRVLSRELLIELTHSGLASPVQRSIDVHVSRIRQKIEPDPDDPSFIKTVRLGGYVFTPPVEEA